MIARLPILPISPTDILAREKRIYNELSEKVFIFDRYIQEIKEAISKAEREDFFYREAFNRAVEDIGLVAFDILITKALEACIQTKEFNWPQYINQLEGALLANRNELVVIIPENNGILVTINTDLLGEVDEWGAAVQAAREAGEFGLVKNPADRSRMWAEKIYKTAREGRTLTRKTKDGVKNITDQYSGKYSATLDSRMSFLDANKAPFWYLIEHGNADAPFTQDSGGTPYPVFAPTNFIEEAQNAIGNHFEELYFQYKEIVSTQLFEDLGLPVGESYRDAYRESVEILKEGIDTGTTTEVNVNKLIGTVQQASVRFEAYKTRTGARISARSKITGLYISLPKE